MQVSVVIPNWNGARRLDSLLRALGEQTVGVGEIVVVDNGSSDNSVELARSYGATIIQFERNVGFAKAVNAGIKTARSELVVVLNNDVELKRDWIEKASAALGQAPFAVGKLLSAQDHALLDGCFDAVCRGACAWRCGAARPDESIWNQPRTVQFPPFTAVLLRRQFFVDLGGLDEGLESYLEDVDFGLRCASKGYTGVYVPDAVGYHEGSATLGRWNARTVRQISRNQVLLVARHYSPGMLLRFGWPIAIAQILWGLVAAKNGAGLAWLQGKIDGVRLFESNRRNSSDSLASILGSSERQIRELQRLTGWDWYWRIYFALT